MLLFRNRIDLFSWGLLQIELGNSGYYRTDLTLNRYAGVFV